jgi:preprotein translocase subunit SecB
MAENENTNQTAAQDQQQFILQKIYVKDLSFETPNSPESFTQQWEPEVNIELNSSGKPLADNMHEVVLGITVTVKLQDKVVYLAEIHQAGIFTITGYVQADTEAMLGSYCPNILFPYAREVVSDLVTRGGFPQLLLAPVNFDALYQEHLKKRAEEQQTEGTQEQGNVH